MTSMNGAPATPAVAPHGDAPAGAPPAAELSGWGHYPVALGRQLRGEDLAEITARARLSRGLGRAYGDAALPATPDDLVVTTTLADRLLAFDPASGRLRAEAGLSLRALNRWSMPRGWFTPVTPGTQFVTLGGMVAADVHGKNHHRNGCFGEHVTSLTVRVADGRVVECSDEHEAELFRATIGGMGLTGHILEVEFRLESIPSPWIWAESDRCDSLDALLKRLQEAGDRWPFTVCWVDCLNDPPQLGRGTFMCGRWAEPGEAPATAPSPKGALTVPFFLPSWFLRPWQVRLFNRLNYKRHGARTHRGIQHPEAFFYPLDVVHEWNRLYGRRGFTQYQAVLPVADDASVPRRFLELLHRESAPVFLCVMKDCGKEGKGLLSFPRPGVSFALDLPVDGAATQRLVDVLDEFVIASGGRVYLAKDAFTRAEHYRRMDARLDAFTQVRQRWDPDGHLRSAQSVRLFGDER
jgi:decaprenylphospho-beta-D-ribofuranose 2-oxidase